MQWILVDIPIGRNIQTVRMAKNMTQAEDIAVVEQLQLMGRLCQASDLKVLKV